MAVALRLTPPPSPPPNARALQAFFEAFPSEGTRNRLEEIASARPISGQISSNCSSNINTPLSTPGRGGSSGGDSDREHQRGNAARTSKAGGAAVAGGGAGSAHGEGKHHDSKHSPSGSGRNSPCGSGGSAPPSGPPSGKDEVAPYDPALAPLQQTVDTCDYMVRQVAEEVGMTGDEADEALEWLDDSPEFDRSMATGM